ncbi:sulfate adenylyltransferase subunit 1, partial [Gordonia effusa NBRC 100432]
YVLATGTRTTRATVSGFNYRLDVNSLHRDSQADQLQ